MSEKTLKKIGITGVIGAGKSSVIEILKGQNYTVLDCDRINDDLLKKHHAGYTALVSVFGTVILDENDEISRLKMSHHIFSNSINKQKAEAILHPLIKKEIMQQVHDLKDEKLVFIEVPLLYEVGWQDFFDQVWVVASDEELLLTRLMQFRNVDRKEASIRLSHQMSQDEKVKKADVTIWNNSDKEHLKQQIYDILVRE